MVSFYKKISFTYLLFFSYSLVISGVQTLNRENIATAAQNGSKKTVLYLVGLQLTNESKRAALQNAFIYASNEDMKKFIKEYGLSIGINLDVDYDDDNCRVLRSGPEEIIASNDDQQLFFEPLQNGTDFYESHDDRFGSVLGQLQGGSEDFIPHFSNDDTSDDSGEDSLGEVKCDYISLDEFEKKLMNRSLEEKIKDIIEKENVIAFKNYYAATQGSYQKQKIANSALYWAKKLDKPFMIKALKNYNPLEVDISRDTKYNLIESLSTQSPLSEEQCEILDFVGSDNAGQHLVKKNISDIDEVDINELDAQGLAPLHHAVVLNDYTCVEGLLSCKDIEVDILTRDEGLSPLCLALCDGKMRIAQLLKEHGACLSPQAFPLFLEKNSDSKKNFFSEFLLCHNEVIKNIISLQDHDFQKQGMKAYFLYYTLGKASEEINSNSGKEHGFFDLADYIIKEHNIDLNTIFFRHGSLGQYELLGGKNPLIAEFIKSRLVEKPQCYGEFMKFWQQNNLHQYKRIPWKAFRENAHVSPKILKNLYSKQNYDAHVHSFGHKSGF